jgi:hypothetical protein
MSDVLNLPIITADLDGYVSKAGLTCVHDRALDGDEHLHVGKRVLVSDGCGGTELATVVQRDEAAGLWYLHYARTRRQLPSVRSVSNVFRAISASARKTFGSP